jgi:hypothetical protein
MAITVGGTPTSSNGGTAAKLMVFSLGGSPDRVNGTRIVADEHAIPAVPLQTAARTAKVAKPARVSAARVAAAGPARIALGTTQLTVRGWTPSSNDTVPVTGRLLLGGKPVANARIRVDSYVITAATSADGSFSYAADYTLARRHVVSVANASSARIGGKPLSAAQKAAVQHAGAAFTVAYGVSSLKARAGKGNTVIVTGHLANSTGVAPPTVVLYTYQLTGRITDSAGKPVENAFVVTRTADRNFWTFSQPSNANGDYRSFYTASDQGGEDPVPLSMQVTLGKVAYGAPLGVTVNFKALRSASVDFQLPTAVGNPVAGTPTTKVGAIYEGLLVGVQGPNGVIVPVGGNWPDKHGNFRVVLPASAHGKTVRVFEDTRQVFAAAAAPGGPVVPGAWPHGLAPSVPQGVASIHLPG